MRNRPPYLQRERTRHGKTVWYFRRADGPRVRIHGEFMSAEFMKAYEAALAGGGAPAATVNEAATLRWLVDRYRESSAWAELALATRKQREVYMRAMLETSGDFPYAEIVPADIEAARQRRLLESPTKAESYMKAVKALFAWAASPASSVASPDGHQLLRFDPAAGLRTSSTRKGKAKAEEDDPYSGFPAWTEEEVTRFESQWPIGTTQRLALAIPLYTGLRRGDVAVLGGQHVKNGIIQLQTEKTGTWVTIRILPELQHVIDNSPTGDLTFIGKPNGEPYTKESLGNMFRDACDAAQIDKSAHGLRKLAAIRMALNQATVPEMNATFGWKGSRMAMLYIEAADRARLSLGASDKMRKA